jgi:CTD small phosphatase-like protein 2
VLDLDETLAHCDLLFTEKSDVKFNVKYKNTVFAVSGNLRPFCIEFIKRCSELYELVLFTASLKDYADQLASIIDPLHRWFKYRLFRDSCTLVNGTFIKNLENLGRDLSKTIIVDNSPIAFGYQVSNGIPIRSWYADQHDQELPKLLEFLESIANVNDVR